MPEDKEDQIGEMLDWTEVRFATFLSGRFTTMAVINPPERKLAKPTHVDWVVYCTDFKSFYDTLHGHSNW
jgi:hypothetical protein